MTHWYETSEWLDYATGDEGPARDRELEIDAGHIAVAADRRLLATKIRELPEGLRKGDVVLGDVLAVLEADS